MQLKSSRGVQQHEVDAAADALLAERLRPTVERVRMKIGRGSPNTVAPMLEGWFAGLAPRLGVVPAQENLAAGPPPALRQGMQQLWNTAVQLARDEAAGALLADQQALAHEREEVAAARNDISGQLTSAEQRTALMQESLQNARQQVDESVGRLRDAQVQLQVRDQELAEARASIARLVEQKDAAARDYGKRIERLEAEREKATQRGAASEQRLLAEVDRARQEAKKSAKLASDLEALAATQRAQFERVRETLGDTIHKLQVERAQLQERLAAIDKTTSTRKAKAVKKPVRRVGTASAAR